MVYPKGAAIIILFIVVFLISGCQPAILDSPRVATQSALATTAPIPSRSPVFSEAPTSTAETLFSQSRTATLPEGVGGANLTIWINETDEAHSNLMEEMASEFSAEKDTLVEFVMVSPQLLPDLVHQAVLSDTLPDIIIHPVTYTAGWVEQGIINPELAEAAVQVLGESTFQEGALDAVQLENGLHAAIPIHGWQQLLIYRTDWFSRLGLNPPDDFESILLAAETIFDPESPISGIVVPTDATLASTQQVFEFVASANGCELVEASGRIALLHPACLEALEFYRVLINDYSPIGFQTDISALNAYISGRTGMIIASPAVLPVIAGLDSELVPSCADCRSPEFLLENSGLINRLSGNEGNPSSSMFSEFTALGLTTVAEPEPALAFANYWFNEGYDRWLSVNPERKVPLRTGSKDQIGKYLNEWANNQLGHQGPIIEQMLGADGVSLLSSEIDNLDRWGFGEGQGTVMSILYWDLLLSPLLQDMLSGYFTSSQSIVEMYNVMVNAIPDYAHPHEVVPTPTP